MHPINTKKTKTEIKVMSCDFSSYVTFSSDVAFAYPPQLLERKSKIVPKITFFEVLPQNLLKINELAQSTHPRYFGLATALLLVYK